MAELVKSFGGYGYLQVMTADHYKVDEAFIILYSYRQLSDTSKRFAKLAYKTNKDTNVVIVPLLDGTSEINSASCHINYPYMCYTYRIGAIGATMDTDQTGRIVGIIHMEDNEHYIYDTASLGITDQSSFNGTMVDRTMNLAGVGILKLEREVKKR